MVSVYVAVGWVNGVWIVVGGVIGRTVNAPTEYRCCGDGCWACIPL